MLSGEDCRIIADGLSTKFGLPLVCELDEQNGFRGWVLRYTEQVEDGYAFDVWLSSTNRRAEAIFRASPFSGPLLRSISRRLESGTAAWNAELDQAKRDDVLITVDMNGRLSDGQLSVLKEPIRDLEVEAQVRVASADRVAHAAEQAATACLAVVLSTVELDAPAPSIETLPEGARTQITVNKYERNPVARMRCIEHFGSECWVCDFDFSVYGPAGKGFIEVHHRVPISLIGRTYQVNPITDLIPLCSNCHSMAHRSNPPITPEDLRKLRGLPQKDSLHQFQLPSWTVTAQRWRASNGVPQVRFNFRSPAEKVTVDVGQEELLRCLEAAGDGVKTEAEAGVKLPVVVDDAGTIEVIFGLVVLYGSPRDWEAITYAPDGEFFRLEDTDPSCELPSLGPEARIALSEVSIQSP